MMKKIYRFLIITIFALILCGCNFHVHTFTQTVIPPTCENKGYTEFKCACGMIAKNDFVVPLGHDFTDWSIVKEATEEETGLQERKCQICEIIEQESLPKLDHVHKYQEMIVEPKCAEQGYTEHICACGYSYRDSFVNCLDHDYSDWVILKDATELETGKKEKTCTRCSEKIVLDIPKLEHTHNYTKTIISPTCTEQGYTLYECYCTHSYQEDFINAIGHNYSDWKVTIEATDLQDGSKEKVCSNCNNKVIEVIPKLNHTHSYTKTIISPKCEEQGYTLYKCYCNDEYKDNYTNATGHNKIYKVIKKSSYTEEGIIEYSCTRCSFIETKQLNYFACSHNYLEKENYSSTNSFPGLKVLVCEFCVDSKSQIVKPSTSITKPSISLTQYALSAMNKSIEYSKQTFTSVISKNQKELFMMPYMSVNEYKIVKDFAVDLVKSCKSEKEKARKIYEWIVNNINYDTNAYSQSVYLTFQNKKAVCFGYSSLLHDMLSAVGIMSSYVSGYTSYTALPYSDIFNHVNNNNSHSWIYAFVNNEVLIMDATWADGYNDINYGFDMQVSSMYKTHLVMTVDEVSIIPDDIDYRNYSDTFLNINDYMVYTEKGTVNGNINFIKITRNNIVDIMFISNNNKYSLYNEKDVLGCLVKHGFYCSDISKQNIVDNWTYSLTNGITYTIPEIMNYIKLLNNTYGYNIKFELPEPIKKHYS